MDVGDRPPNNNDSIRCFIKCPKTTHLCSSDKTFLCAALESTAKRRILSFSLEDLMGYSAVK